MLTNTGSLSAAKLLPETVDNRNITIEIERIERYRFRLL